MKDNVIQFPIPACEPNDRPTDRLMATDSDDAEHQLMKLIETDKLDLSLAAQPAIARNFERVLTISLTAAYEAEPSSETAHRFLQRVLYRINRLKLFWYDDLRRYANERSAYLQALRDQIEEEWQQWELTHLETGVHPAMDVKRALLERTAADDDPPLSADGRFFRDKMTMAGYRRLLEIASLDGVVEASQLSRTLGGVGNEVHSVLTRLLLEAYGGGRFARKRSSYFITMLASLGMETEPEYYFESVPWEVLATINLSFLLSERKRHFLRYMGGRLYIETAAPAAFRNYKAAAERLGLPATATGYWDVHIKENHRHSRRMFYDVALPLAARYPADAWELVLGYDQQRFMSHRASAAIAQSVREAEQVTLHSFKARKRTRESR
jgi:hypothetical protein